MFCAEPAPVFGTAAPSDRALLANLDAARWLLPRPLQAVGLPAEFVAAAGCSWVGAAFVGVATRRDLPWIGALLSVDGYHLTTYVCRIVGFER